MCWPIGTLDADAELTRGSACGIHELLLQSEIETSAPVTPNSRALVYLAVLAKPCRGGFLKFEQPQIIYFKPFS